MEVCNTLCLSKLPLTPSFHSQLPIITSLSLNKSSHFQGVNFQRKVTVLRVTSDDENTKFTEATLRDVPSDDNDVTLNNFSPFGKTVFNDSKQPDPSAVEESLSEESEQPFQELLDNFDIKLDSEDSYTILLFGGGGALVTVWLLSAIVGAIDSIPVVPKLLEVVGLGYSVWFASRYLLFKKNREELGAKIDELKREVLGSSDN